VPEVELRADYDRDGRLSRRAAEFAARSSGPGAIVAPNLDRDGRALPSSAQVVSPPPRLDFAQSPKRGRDNDPVPLRVVVSAAATAAFASLALRVEGDNAPSVALIDGRSRVIAPRRTATALVEFDLPLRSGPHQFALEASRVTGSPLGAADGSLTLKAVGRDAAGAETMIDQGRLLLAGFIVAADLAPAEALYIAQLDDNAPALRDVRAGMAATRPKVPLREVAPDNNRGDGWLQDQFQVGHVIAPGRRMRVVLHLPRLRTNAQLGANQRNLAELVRTHFPSKDLGLIDDFWQRTLPLVHRRGAAQLSFTQTSTVFRLLHRVSGAAEVLLAEVFQLCGAAQKKKIDGSRPFCDGIFLAESVPVLRTQIPDLLQRVEGLVALLLAKVDASERAGLMALLDAARRLAQTAERLLPVSGRPGHELFELRIGSNTFEVDGDHLNQLSEAVDRMHDSLVYGGNIEVSPATATDPFGKVVIGESDERQIDSDLRDLFRAGAAVQPVVAIDTTWLEVGHVDELVCFLPNRGGDQAHVVMRASPEVARALVDRASRLYVSGIPWYHPDTMRPWRPLTTMRHRMNRGEHPVTRLFRGKLWLHYHPRRQSGDGEEMEERGEQADRELAQVVPPPRIYRELVKWYDGLFTDTLAPFYPDRDTDSSYYKAALSPWDIVFFEGGTNGKIVAQRLGRPSEEEKGKEKEAEGSEDEHESESLDEVLAAEFPDFPIRRLPVFFDRADSLETGSTAAFTPNLVNLQYVDGTVLIPNPFGPRMHPADAAQVVTEVLRDEGLAAVAGTVSPRFFRRHRLDVTEVWINPLLENESIATPFRTLTDLAREFSDGFGTATRAKVEERIRHANRPAFDASGRLKQGWRKLRIPEGTVDLFQAYTHAILVAQGLEPVWVDSWYYHVRTGEIHCATNVLRKLPRTRTPWWSRVSASAP
jgi:Protein-arginine deiminase (PAD)